MTKLLKAPDDMQCICSSWVGESIPY